MKLYLFKSQKVMWDSGHTALVVASSKNKAIDTYVKRMKIKDDLFKVEEISLTDGLLIEVVGDKNVSISVRRSR
jgi:hypothetical protein